MGVSGALFWVCGALFWVSGGGWGWVHCLVMPIVTTKKKLLRILLLDVVRHAQLCPNFARSARGVSG